MQLWNKLSIFFLRPLCPFSSKIHNYYRKKYILNIPTTSFLTPTNQITVPDIYGTTTFYIPSDTSYVFNWTPNNNEVTATYSTYHVDVSVDCASMERHQDLIAEEYALYDYLFKMKEIQYEKQVEEKRKEMNNSISCIDL